MSTGSFLNRACLRILGAFLIAGLLVFSLLPQAVRAERPETSLPFFRISETIASPYFRLIDDPDTAGTYQWSVISEQGKTLDEGTAAAYEVPPIAVYAENSILCLRTGGGNAFWYTFYDVVRELVSPVYQNVIACRGEYVLYTDLQAGKWALVCASLFSGERRNVRLIADLAPADGHVEQAQWIAEDAAWSVTYISSPSYDETTVLFPIAPSEATLYPIRENGLWGYMNRLGEVVIASKWVKVTLFSGGYAAVSTETYPNIAFNALIDRCGDYVIAPQDALRIIETRYTWDLSLNSRTDSGVGFVDKASGFCLMPVSGYRWLLNWYEDGSGPVPIEDADGNIGYLSRTTGETVIPFIYNEMTEDIGFCGGYALPATAPGDTGDDHEVTDLCYHLIDTSGREVPFPDGFQPVSGVAENRVIICGENGWGLADADGNVIVEPVYDEIMPPSDGIATFVTEHEDGKYMGCMDLDGNVIVPDRYRISLWDNGWVVYPYSFANGYAVIRHFVNEGRESREILTIINTSGQELLSIPARRDDDSLMKFSDSVLENGLLWYSVYTDPAQVTLFSGTGIRYGLIRIQETSAGFLTDAIYESPSGGILDAELYSYDLQQFSEGLQPVRSDGLWGYIDENAEWVFPPFWDRAASFQDGLALVEKDGKLAYIDHEGNYVWQETG